MTVVRIEAGTLRSGVKVATDLHGPGLPAAFHILAHHQPRTATARGEMNKVAVALERGPLVTGDKDLTARAVVLATRQVHEHGLGRLTVFRPARTKMCAEVLIEFDLADARRRRPVPLLHTRRHKPPVGRETEAVRITEPSGENFELVATRDAAHTLIPRRKVPPPLGIPLQPNDEVVSARRGLHDVRHTLVKIRFIIAIKIVQAGQLIAPQHIQLVLHHLHPERLIQPGREAFPAQLLQFFVDALHEPHFAGHGGNRCGAVAEEVVRRDEEQRTMRILERDGDPVRGKRCLRSEFAPRLDPSGPLGRATERLLFQA